MSYYAHQVQVEYLKPVLPYNQPLYLQFEYGIGLYLGWGAMVIGRSNFPGRKTRVNWG